MADPKILPYFRQVQVTPTPECQKNWNTFKTNNLDIEMVLSKKGRKMFPGIDFTVSNLPPTGVYNIYLEFLTNNEGYRFDQNQQSWYCTNEIRSGPISNFINDKDAQMGGILPIVPDKKSSDFSNISVPPSSYILKYKASPVSGFAITKYGISFGDVRLTNKEKHIDACGNFSYDRENIEHINGSSPMNSSTVNSNSKSKRDDWCQQVVLQSLKKYTLRLHLVRQMTTDIFMPGIPVLFNPESFELQMLNRLPPFSEFESNMHSIESYTLDREVFKFITVTSYQNAAVTDLKILKNPQTRGPSAGWKSQGLSNLIKFKEEKPPKVDDYAKTFNLNYNSHDNSRNSGNSSGFLEMTQNSGLDSLTKTCNKTDSNGNSKSSLSVENDSMFLSTNEKYDEFGCYVNPKPVLIGNSTLSYGIACPVFEDDGSIGMLIDEQQNIKQDDRGVGDTFGFGSGGGGSTFGSFGGMPGLMTEMNIDNYFSLPSINPTNPLSSINDKKRKNFHDQSSELDLMMDNNNLNARLNHQCEASLGQVYKRIHLENNKFGNSLNTPTNCATGESSPILINENMLSPPNIYLNRMAHSTPLQNNHNNNSNSNKLNSNNNLNQKSLNNNMDYLGLNSTNSAEPFDPGFTPMFFGQKDTINDAFLTGGTNYNEHIEPLPNYYDFNNCNNADQSNLVQSSHYSD